VSVAYAVESCWVMRCAIITEVLPIAIGLVFTDREFDAYQLAPH